MMQGMLFNTEEPPGRRDAPAQALAPGAWLFPGLVHARAPALLSAIGEVVRRAPLRHMTTPGGGRMSVGMSGCGARVWVSDAAGYRYETHDPRTGRPWPPMPALLRDIAGECAQKAGYDGFVPDSGLINRYGPGDRMGLHQDRDERRDAPIVSISLGVSAVFLWGGVTRSDPVRRIVVRNGDVVVWGGPSRLAWHGIAPVPQAQHPLCGDVRYNLTFRRTA
ncbi:DNA oxidative demethylase AlkB [Gluconacetobacter entanii]|uniref:DNA oxidative demethylase AlkB n=1 Tax=Gluconacetobacter entanii TaxID=108528 RepID=UPI001C931EA5|nr:DNA oxidative demethylase AlkB [Gluconacetobacter entanii]MBY4638811.1 DNA oxidative demethylase AlkB [Gluconacetobacter entanii]MCW4581273.1 DNA oxidative demethylase AlkB [Gluconacetobacter entanii]MCW4584588.1 DNA oxidative demethylase AlkB [Gluconacetobacter entanii]MCW4588002.1 DNA oxidative demethylase AlkB [Gluconacetobacter entanii]